MRILALGLGVIVGLVALAPARLLLPAPPLAATSVSGSVWQAQLAGAALGRMQLGDVGLALQPGALLKGRLGWQTAGRINGTLWRGFTAGGVAGLNGRLNGSPLTGLPLAGISLADVMATLDGAGRCEAAGGQVTADLALPLAGQRQISGAPRCDGAALLLPLASGDGRVRLDVTVSDGSWTARLAVAGAGVGEATALIAAGFREQGGALVKEESGA
ncbi:type II secretion system protein N [Sandarakinorhabdus sp. AAP62]|uniref:type II secretion system protein N n=1 Tax=Sandarakinorhabdus sp. AAP62 TaxID=1248916 RepID=UPI00031B3D2C|nr:type II secretion system protein N [Sandarakinorhabdus sp. AAP62]